MPDECTPNALEIRAYGAGDREFLARRARHSPVQTVSPRDPEVAEEAEGRGVGRAQMNFVEQ
jgi:hypothetical protein